MLDTARPLAVAVQTDGCNSVGVALAGGSLGQQPVPRKHAVPQPTGTGPSEVLTVTFLHLDVLQCPSAPGGSVVNKLIN